MAASIHYLHQRRSAKSWKLGEDPRRIEFVSDGTIFVLLPHDQTEGVGTSGTVLLDIEIDTLKSVGSDFISTQSSLQERGAPRCQGRQLSDGSKGHFDV